MSNPLWTASERERQARRDVFAAAALAGMLAADHGDDPNLPHHAWEYADAMLEEDARRTREANA